MADDTLLTVADLRLQHRQAGVLLDGVSLTVKRGQILGVVGESGSGKSLTGLSVLGLQPEGRLSGTLKFDGEDLTRFSSRDWRRFRGRRAAMIFQDPMTAFLPVRRIGPQIVERIRLHTKLSRQAASERVVSLLGRMGVPSPEQTAQRFPHELSGGLRQRAMIAMALSCDPELLIADEPTTALDVTVQAQILTLLKEIGAREASVMLITHDMGVVAQSCTDVAVLYAGMVIETGPVASVLQAPLHPYTQALLKAIPPMDGPRPARLPVIDGAPPSPETRPVGLRLCASLPPDHPRMCPPPDNAGGGRPSCRLCARRVSALLQARNIARTYKLGSGASLRAVDGVSLELARGETLALVGESGCGKSTLGRLLMGFDRPDRGEILFDGQDMTKRSSREQRVLRSQIQMVFQDSASAFNPRWTIGSALAEPFRIHKRPWSRQSLEALLDRVGLSGAFFDRYPGALSGGQRQRLNIARAIALSPRLIVADEPVSALDVSVQAQIVNLLRQLQADLDLACLFISHDLAVVRQISDRIAVMYLGAIVEEGETLSLLASPSHPYTRALVDAVPQPGKPLGAPLQGDVPSPLFPPNGCRFHTRCPVAQRRCSTERPELEARQGHRRVACHFPLM